MIAIPQGDSLAITILQEWHCVLAATLSHFAELSNGDLLMLLEIFHQSVNLSVKHLFVQIEGV